MRLESISVSINTNNFLIIVGVITLAAYSFYVYKYTIPVVSNGLKFFLTAVRILILILLFLIIFEPVGTLISSEKIEPETFIFIDNSNSIAIKDSVIRCNMIKDFVEELNSAKGKKQFYLFDSDIKNFNPDSSGKLIYNGQSTNFSNIISSIKKSDKNISSVVILSDGIINDGDDPIYEAEKLPYPIFTVGIGDTTQYRDIRVGDVLFNQYIYAQKPTEIEATILQFGFDSQTSRVVLFKDDKQVETKDIHFNSSGINKIKFDFTPDKSGEVKLKIAVNQLTGEQNFINNSKTFFVNVLQNKLKIGLIAGSPSADLSSISNALESDKNLDVKKIIQVSQNKFWKNFNTAVIDSSDILFLVDFPSRKISTNLYAQIVKAIRNKNKPFFFLLSQNVDLKKLREIENIIPFSISNISDGFIQAQPVVQDNLLSSAFSGNTGKGEVWNNLPPILVTTSAINAKPGSEILLSSILKNTRVTSPLIITRNIAGQKSIAVIAGEIWKWELLTSEKYPGFFSNLIQDFVKWLGVTDKQKQFSVRTSKKIYGSSEHVEFTAELYDQTFTPVDSAAINLTIKKNGESFDVNFQKVRPGIFTATIESPKPGDYSYEASARFGSSNLKSNIGRFTVGETNIEKENTRMDINFLKQLASSTNGKYFPIENSDDLKAEINKLNSNASKEKLSSREIDFRSNGWILLLIICLFAVEWFTRKRSGML
jgi:hypothetical protein